MKTKRTTTTRTLDAGDPDPARELPPPHLGQEHYMVLREWIVKRVVMATIALPFVGLGALALGVSGVGAALLTVAVAPLGVMANAVAKLL